MTWNTAFPLIAFVLVLVGIAGVVGWRLALRRQKKIRAAQVESYQRTYVGMQGWVAPPVNPPTEGSAPDNARAVIGGKLGSDTQPFGDTATVTAMQESKQLFMRLISAWDNANAQELKLLLTPAAYGALVDEATLAPRPGAPTDILTLTAEVVKPEQIGEERTDVRFSGMYRTALASAARRFDAVWTLERGQAGLQVAHIEPI
jgi:predicted lipid-binding transport protein (Tim44 family)